MPNTIVLKGKGIRKERLAGGVITPGHLLELTSTDTVVVHNSVSENAQSMFAIENEVIGGEIDTDYASGDNVIYEVLPPGAEVNALVIDGEPIITRGDFVESGGDGGVVNAIVSASSSDLERNAHVGIALETVDNSGGGSPVRIRIEIV